MDLYIIAQLVYNLIFMKFSLFYLLAAILFVFACEPAKDVPTLDTNTLISDLEYLSSDELEGRYVGSEGNAKAREFILGRYKDLGIAPFGDNYEHEFTFERRSEMITGVNVLGSIAGKMDSIILISAHYDHLGIRDSLIYNGADDNASGTAGLLAMMDYFSKIEPKHTLVFAAFDAEEGGLRGARALAEDSVFLQKVKLNVNMDMIAQNDKNELYAVGTYHYPWLAPILEKVETGEVQLLFGHDRPEDGDQDWTNQSDQGAFHRKGVPILYFGVEDHEHYHQATDEFETIPQEFYKASVQTILNAILELDKSL